MRSTRQGNRVIWAMRMRLERPHLTSGNGASLPQGLTALAGRPTPVLEGTRATQDPGHLLLGALKTARRAWAWPN
jgi:hypothetical protein